MPTSQGFRGLRVYQLAFKLAMEIHQESKKFPREELFSLTDQIRRASRSVAGNIGEGYRRKLYPKMFVSKMSDADVEDLETQVWIEFSYACGYISADLRLRWIEGYEEVGSNARQYDCSSGAFLSLTACRGLAQRSVNAFAAPVCCSCFLSFVVSSRET